MLIRAKEKISRRYGQNLFLKALRSASQKSAMVRHPSPPGVHGKNFRRGRSDFGLHLAEKQMIRFSYGVAERQMRRYFGLAGRSKGNTADEFLKILETRLDNVLFRSGLTASRLIAKQLIRHGHILVNGRKATIPSLAVKPGSNVSPSQKSLAAGLFKEAPLTLKNFQMPGWLEADGKNFKVKILRWPAPDDVQTPFNFQLLVEYYSR